MRLLPFNASNEFVVVLMNSFICTVDRLFCVLAFSIAQPALDGTRNRSIILLNLQKKDNRKIDLHSCSHLHYPIVRCTSHFTHRWCFRARASRPPNTNFQLNHNTQLYQSSSISQTMPPMTVANHFYPNPCSECWRYALRILSPNAPIPTEANPTCHHAADSVESRVELMNQETNPDTHIQWAIANWHGAEESSTCLIWSVAGRRSGDPVEMHQRSTLFGISKRQLPNLHHSQSRAVMARYSSPTSQRQKKGNSSK